MDNMFEDLFDNIDDFLNFPCEDVEGDIIGCGVGGDIADGSECNRLKDVWHSPQVTLSGSGSDSLGGDISSELPTELLVPYEDIAHLEWLSTFVEDSFSMGNIAIDEDESVNINMDKEHNDMNKENNESHHFQTHSPVSVLDSSSSSSSCSEIKTMPINPEIVVPGRARSKRPRPATFKPRPVFPPPMPPSYCISDPTPPFPSSQFSSSLDSLAESETTLKIPNPLPTEPKKKKIKVKFSPMPGSVEQYTSQQTVAVRKCLHCQITKTPQWRMGPLGPKTLCNACGVRYKSGRLFPEYRPAASPTFVPTLHSNSHRKVLEMRTRGDLNMAETWSDDCGSLITYEGRGILPF